MLWIAAVLALGISINLVLDMSRSNKSPSVYDVDDREKLRECFSILKQYNVDLNRPDILENDIRSFAEQLKNNPELEAEVLDCLEKQSKLCSNADYKSMKPFLCQNVSLLESELTSLLEGGFDDDLWTSVSEVSRVDEDESHLSGINTL